jgi:hypothetical protein
VSAGDDVTAGGNVVAVGNVNAIGSVAGFNLVSLNDVVVGDDLTYASPRTYFYEVPAVVFVSGYDALYYEPFGSVKLTSAAYADLFAPVRLPDGAQVIGLRGYYYDNQALDDGHFGLTLSRRGVTAATQSSMAHTSFDSSGVSTAVQSSVDVTIASPVIDNENFQYFLRLEFFNDDTFIDTRFYGARISYTLDTLAPAG